MTSGAMTEVGRAASAEEIAGIGTQRAEKMQTSDDEQHKTTNDVSTFPRPLWMGYQHPHLWDSSQRPIAMALTTRGRKSKKSDSEFDIHIVE